MKSINFEFLRDSWPELAELGGFAESYAHPDPASGLIQTPDVCRIFGRASVYTF